jgi:hypothetical protein
MKRTLVASLLGLVVMLVWLVVINGILGFTRSIEMNTLPDERAVYAFLTQQVVEPGRYVCNPEITPAQEFPGDEPVYTIYYSGLGHADAGQEMLIELLAMLLALLVGAWLLARSSPSVLSRYGTRVFFFSMIGVVVALLGLMNRFGIGAHPLGDGLALAAHDLFAWVIAGLVVSWVVRPTEDKRAG